MKIKFDLTWKNFIRGIGIGYLIYFAYLWYETKEMILLEKILVNISSLIVAIEIPFIIKFLFVVMVLSFITLFPFILLSLLMLLLPLKKSKERLEIDKAKDRIRKDYKIKDYKKRLNKLTRKDD